MKKIFSWVLSLALILSLLPSQALAAPVLAFSSVKEGEKIVVTLTLPDYEDVMTAEAVVEFPGTVLELESVTSGEYPPLDFEDPNVTTATNNGKVTIAHTNETLGTRTVGGKYAKLTFSIKSGAAPGSYDIKLTELTMSASDYVTNIAASDAATLPKTISVVVPKAPISSVTIADLEEPIKGKTPDTSVTVTPSSLAADVSWFDGATPVTGNFAANTAYTVKIKLTASGGDNFAETVTASGYDVTRESDTELLLTKTFDATAKKALTGLEITTAPTKTTYVHGSGFDPAGMVVKATYDDGSIDDNFKNYTVEYKTVGKGYLCVGHTGVTLKKDGQTVDVTGLTVNAKPLTVTGLTAVNREYKPGNTLVDLTGGTLSGVVGSEDVSLLSTPTTGTISNVGVGDNKDVSITPLSLKGSDAGNYTLTQPTGIKVNITPKDISGAVITYGTQSTYNGTEQDVVITSVELDGTTLNAGYYTLDPATSKATDVKEKTLKIKGQGNYGGSATAATAWKLQQATPTAANFDTSGLAASYPYTGSEQTAPVPTTAKTGMGSVTVNYPGGTTPQYVGDYDLKFTVAEGQNYTAAGPFSYGIMKITAVEDPAVITATASVTKGGHQLDLRTLVSGAKGDVTFTISGVTSTHAVLESDGHTLTSTGIHGTVNINVTIKEKDENGDTKVEYTGKTGTITVTVLDKTPASVTTAPAPKTGLKYDGTEQALVTKGVADGGTMQYSLGSSPWSTEIPTAKDAGTYSVQYKVVGDETHIDTTPVTLTVTIAPKTLTAADLEKSGGSSSKVYDGNTTSSITVRVKASSLCGTDTLAINGSSVYNSAKVADATTITFTPTPITTGNYALADTEVLTITGAKITAREVTLTGVTATSRPYAKDDLEVALTGGTVSGVVSGDTVTVDLTNAKGTMADADAGTGKAVTVTGAALGGADKGNYKLKEQPTVTATITQATAPTLTDIKLNQRYTVTTEQSKAIGTVGMPADAGTLTYAKGTATQTGSVTIDSWNVDSTTGKVTYKLSNGKANDTVTLPVIVKSTNYADATVNVKITLVRGSSGGGGSSVAVAPDMPLLRYGSRGEAVKILQEKLNAKGYNSGNVDGIFGVNTRAAVLAFQKANGLGVDGIVGKLTWAKLYDAAPVSVVAPAAQPMLRSGSRGEAVRRLQELLNAKGFDSGKVDGIFGVKTRAAVIAFQKANGLSADGIVGPLTWGKLI